MENKQINSSFKYMLILAVPIFIELFLQMVVGYSDQIMMSNYDTAVTAITNCNTIINMIINTFTVFSSAAIILITQYKGAKDETREGKMYGTTFYFNLIASIVVSIILVLFGKYFLSWIKCPTEAMQEAKQYMYIAGGFIFFQILSATFSSFLKSNSLMKESMLINLILNIINIIGNLILIPHLKIVGVAISSTFSRALGCVIMFIVFKIKIKQPLKIKDFIHSNGMIKKLISVGAPSGGESFSYNTSQIIIQTVINGFAIAVINIKTYASMFAMVTYMFTSAISQAMQVIIGRLLGSGNPDEAEKKIKQTIIAGVIVNVSIAILFFLIAKQSFKIFNVNDPQMLELAKKIMFIEIFLELGRAVNIVCVRALQTSGDIIFPTVLSIIFCWSVAVLGSFLLGSSKVLNLGLCGVWISMALDECFRAVIFLIRFKRGKWKKISLVGGTNV